MHAAVFDTRKEKVVGKLASAGDIRERDVHPESHATLLWGAR
jgi:hypothetical protein